MAERRWTDEQLSAIKTRDKTLLVSAAAGSGKTATLTERIIRSLTDPVSPMDIDSILVVTFTNAAASELRAKISKALTEAVEANPEDKHLKRQLYLLPSAKIRTIDSFCNELLRANCDRVGLPPVYRIADTAECELLAISIIEGLIEAVYNGELPEIASPEEFDKLCDCLTDTKRTEELAEVFRYIHLKCDSAEEGIDLLSTLIKNYETTDLPIEQNAYGKYLMDRYHEMLGHYLSVTEKYIRIFSQGSEAEHKYLGMVEADHDLIKRLDMCKTYEDAKLAIESAVFVKKPTVRKDRTDDMDGYGLLRDMMKDDVEDMKGYFLYTTEMWRGLFDSLHSLLFALYRFEKKFDELFIEEKRRRGALSYADIERYTYKCLINDGKPTDIAKNVASQFDAIYIDEYQDVNSLQNRIFEAISKPNNRFMVGDIKQSIYGFRSACPEIFANMKASFPRIKEAKGDQASIFMSLNFRCDKAIVNFVNNVFDRAFSFVSDSIGYEDGDRLGYSKIQPNGEPEYYYPEVYMLDKTDDEEKMNSAKTVAKKISELLKNGKLSNGNAIRPSDIAIILRNAKDRDVRYASALEALGIPATISGAKDFFLSPEVLLALCLLNTIDNPRRDIYLAGLLASPLFDFTADDLCLARNYDGESLYESLVKCVECNEEFTKGRYFLEKLAYYRAIAEGVSVDTLIYKLYRETGLLALASKSGGKENLTLLYDYARSYEAGSFKGLYNFISFINNIIDKKTTFDDTRVGDSADAVKIVTCHASKGLEYPVVFLVECDGKIYNKDRASRLAFSEDFGISFRLRTPSGLAVVNNPVQDIINHRIGRKLYEEELRVLYVALTRARERLYCVGVCPVQDREKYELKLSLIRDNLSEYSFRNLDSYQEIILSCDGRGAVLPDEINSPAISDLIDCDESLSEEKGEDNLKNSELAQGLIERFTFEYSNPHLSDLPEKMSVSKMSPTVLDGTDDECFTLDFTEPTEPAEEEKPILPAFFSGNEAEESAKRGIATHLVMQFCNFERLKEEGAKSELERLVHDGFISSEDGKRVRIFEIEKFTKSTLFDEMLSAKKIYRELRFNVRLPATLFTQDEEKISAYRGREILVQGVIDCILENPDGSLSLYDYKTDRLTKEELSNKALAEEKLRNKHQMQLGLYSLAVEKIFGKKPEKVAVYSLPLGDTISMI